MYSIKLMMDVLESNKVSKETRKGQKPKIKIDKERMVEVEVQREREERYS